MDYDDWLMIAATAGIDWVNDPPPKEFLTEELVIAALKDSPLDLAQIPEELKTFDVCFSAVYQDDDVLEFVPESLRETVKTRKDAITPEKWLAELGCYTGNHNIKLTQKLLQPDFLRQMVEQNGLTLELVPQELVTLELRSIAEGQDSDRNWEKNIRSRIEKKNSPIVKSGTQIAMEKSKIDKP